MFHATEQEEASVQEDSVRALARALDLLEALRQSPMSLTDLVTRCRLSKATVHRLLSTLKRRGYVLRVRVNHTLEMVPWLRGWGPAARAASPVPSGRAGCTDSTRPEATGG